MTLHRDFPAVSDLARRAKRRIPYFAWEYLDSGTGDERLIDRNRDRLASVEMVPRALGGNFEPETSVTLFGETYAQPFGIAPIGLSGLIWPGAELILAKTAARHNIPYLLSTVANETPETIGPLAKGRGWFQLYPPKDRAVLDDMLARAKENGFRALAVTVDVPINSQRERQVRARLSVPPKLDAVTLSRVAVRPAWALATLRHGAPRFHTLGKYFDAASMAEAAHLVSHVLASRGDWTLLDYIRSKWDGPFIVKGVMSPDDAAKAIDCGAEGVVVSNHGGRQFDAAPASIDALPAIADRLAGRGSILFDSGLRGGLDIARALSRGADFCLLGRAFMFGVAALGERGGDHVVEILREDLRNQMIQLGVRNLGDMVNSR